MQQNQPHLTRHPRPRIEIGMDNEKRGAATPPGPAHGPETAFSGRQPPMQAAHCRPLEPRLGKEHVVNHDAQHSPIMDRAQYRVTPARFVLLELAEHCTGYTVKAMERKIERGDWADGKEYRRAPDGRLHVDLQGYEQWVMKGKGK